MGHFSVDPNHPGTPPGAQEIILKAIAMPGGRSPNVLFLLGSLNDAPIEMENLFRSRGKCEGNLKSISLIQGRGGNHMVGA
jgi:hypothetical protein